MTRYEAPDVHGLGFLCLHFCFDPSEQNILIGSIVFSKLISLVLEVSLSILTTTLSISFKSELISYSTNVMSLHSDGLIHDCLSSFVLRFMLTTNYKQGQSERINIILVELLKYSLLHEVGGDDIVRNNNEISAIKLYSSLNTVLRKAFT